MAVAKCSIDHIKRSRFLRSADRVPVGGGGLPESVMTRRHRGLGRVSSVFMARFLLTTKRALRKASIKCNSDACRPMRQALLVPTIVIVRNLDNCRFGKGGLLIIQHDRLSTIGTAKGALRPSALPSG